MTELSLGEVEALCLKAARGAGYDWGLAEEAGAAARWLAARGLDGPAILLALLEARKDLASLRLTEGRVTQMDDGPVCPIVLGAYISDLGGMAPLAEVPVLRPALLLPFLRDARLGWPGGAVSLGPDGTPFGDIGPLAALERAAVSLERGATGPEGGTRSTVARTGAEVIERLDRLALRTTVPASAGSRADAGAGTDDND